MPGLSDILQRAAAAKAEQDEVNGLIHAAQVRESKDKAKTLTLEKLGTSTTNDDWEVFTEIQGMKMALVLKPSTNIRIVQPVGTNDLLLRVGPDPRQWPTIRDLAHLAALIEEHGLV